jgi:hypothetical protein
VAGLTLALVGGAGVASYAAITQDPVPPPTTQAQVPPPGAPAPAPAPAPGTPPAPGTDPTVPTPSPQQDAPSEELPGDDTDSGSSGSGSGSGSGSSGSSGSGSSGSSGSGSSGSTLPSTPTTTTPAPAPAPTTTPTTPTTPAPDPRADDPRPYDLPPGAVEVYDPDDRDLAAIGAPGLAADGDDRTGFEVVLPPDGRPAGVGLIIDLDARRDVTSINIETSTPGFDVEVYGAAKGIPRRITSFGWQHIADAAAVDASERIPLGEAKGTIRRIVVWITNVPAADRRAVIGEVVVRVRPS